MIKYIFRELWQGLDKVQVEIILEVEVEVEGLLGVWQGDWGVSHITSLVARDYQQVSQKKYLLVIRSKNLNLKTVLNSQEKIIFPQT